MIELLFTSVFIFLAVRIIIASYNLLSNPVLTESHRRSDKLVSILIPARNEEKNLPVLLESLTNIEHENTEVIILDDDSSDQTFEVAESFKTKLPSLQLHKGDPLPMDWKGKNWACQQLAQQAKGKYFLFLDADVKVHRGLISNCLERAEQRSCALISLFPSQEMKTSGEKAVVPLMHYILLSLLPLKLVYSTSIAQVAAANGQCMFFDAETYQEQQWHEQVKSSSIEDIQIARLVKKKNLKMETLLGGQFISCRMYHSWLEGIAGFSKNISGMLLNKAFMLIYFFLAIAAYPILYMYLTFMEVASLIVMIILLKIIISISSRQRIISNLIFHIPQMISLSIIIALSYYRGIFKKHQWKGRSIN